MANLAEQYLAKAKKWKVDNANAEKATAETRINALAVKVQALIDSEGALYIQIPNSGADIPTFKAITTKFGRQYLESLGFRVEGLTTHANIWWGDPATVEKEVDLILNPPPVVTAPAVATPATETATTGKGTAKAKAE